MSERTEVLVATDTIQRIVKGHTAVVEKPSGKWHGRDIGLLESRVCQAQGGTTHSTSEADRRRLSVVVLDSHFALAPAHSARLVQEAVHPLAFASAARHHHTRPCAVKTMSAVGTEILVLPHFPLALWTFRHATVPQAQGPSRQVTAPHSAVWVDYLNPFLISSFSRPQWVEPSILLPRAAVKPEQVLVTGVHA